MNYVQLGKTDLMVSRICFGCWQLSPRFWGDVPLKPWEAALSVALERGVNFIDTADAYGEGYAEECLGNYMHAQGVRDRLVLATKFYWHYTDDGGRYPDTAHDRVLQACEASLRRLRTDRIDLYQVHAFDPLTRPEEVGAALRRLKQEGKVRWCGVSNLNAEQMRMYQAHVPIECLQPLYNLIDRDVECAELPYCQANRVGVIPYSPLHRGLLTGKYRPDTVFTDNRNELPLYHGRAFQRMLAAMDELRPVAADLGLTLPQLAVRWVLTHPAVTAAIAGVKTREHIETILPAAEANLPAVVWHQVAGIIANAKAEALRLL
ncbi:MAG: aldo/keto reductase [Lentisphaerae bacterium]|nr:aldo/keto reductase [Lentisphaerota bacterium]